jgi:hypothetical protein
MIRTLSISGAATKLKPMARTDSLPSAAASAVAPAGGWMQRR